MFNYQTFTMFTLTMFTKNQTFPLQILRLRANRAGSKRTSKYLPLNPVDVTGPRITW